MKQQIQEFEDLGPLLTINYIEYPLDLHRHGMGWGTTYVWGVGLSLKLKEVNMFRTFTNKEICDNLHISYGNLMRFKRRLWDAGYLRDGVLTYPEGYE